MRDLEQQRAVVGYATHGTQSVLDEVGGLSSIPKAGSAEAVNAENVACEVSQHATPLLLSLYGSPLVPATRVNHHTCISTLEGQRHG